MATTPTPAAPAAPAAPAPAALAPTVATPAIAAPPKKRWVSPVNGKDLEDPTNLTWAKCGGSQMEVTPWVELQIAEGKLAFVE